MADHDSGCPVNCARCANGGTPLDWCVMCDEPVDNEDCSPTTVHTQAGPRMAHQTCMLREVIGGIGHLIAHDYWCKQKHDPDAGLTHRQSALLVREYVRVVGIEKAVSIHAE